MMKSESPSSQRSTALSDLKVKSQCLGVGSGSQHSAWAGVPATAVMMVAANAAAASFALILIRFSLSGLDFCCQAVELRTRDRRPVQRIHPRTLDGVFADTFRITDPAPGTQAVGPVLITDGTSA